MKLRVHIFLCIDIRIPIPVPTSINQLGFLSHKSQHQSLSSRIRRGLKKQNKSPVSAANGAPAKKIKIMESEAERKGSGEAVNASRHQQLLHVAMFPFLAYGHIVPFVNLSEQLASEGVAVTFLTTGANATRVSALLSSSPSVRIVPLQLPPVDGLPEGVESTAEMTPAMAELLKQAVDLMRPQVEALLADLRPQLVFHDFSQPWISDAAHPLGIKTVFFSVFSALANAYLMVPARRASESGLQLQLQLHLPPPGFPDQSRSSIQSVPAYQAADFAYVFKRSADDAPPVYERVLSCMRNCSAIAMKTCMDMEGPYIEYIGAQYSKAVLLVGPLVPAGGQAPKGELEERWAKWLNKFPEGSVVVCSFGSETFLSDDAIKELALGLEMTGLPFLLILNFPKTASDLQEDQYSATGDDHEQHYRLLKGKLPDGFEERVGERGRVHSGWVQQQHILRHRSVGGFLCHAGLSSLVEGVLGGCRLVMLPQKGDQYFNARLFGEELGVGVEVRRDEVDGSFHREDVRDAVLKAMAAADEKLRADNNLEKWRRFLSDEDVLREFMAKFVKKLCELAFDQ